MIVPEGCPIQSIVIAASPLAAVLVSNNDINAPLTPSLVALAAVDPVVRSVNGAPEMGVIVMVPPVKGR